MTTSTAGRKASLSTTSNPASAFPSASPAISNHRFQSSSHSTSTSTPSSLVSDFDSYEDDISSWLNDSISSCIPNSSNSQLSISSLSCLDEHLSTLSFQLHLHHSRASQQTSIQINNASNSIPKLSNQISSISNHAQRSLLKLEKLKQSSLAYVPANKQKEQMNEMASKEGLQLNGNGIHVIHEKEGEQSLIANQNQEEISNSLSRLTTLSLLSSRLSSSRDVLRDAEKWSTLAYDVQSALGIKVKASSDSDYPDSILPSLSLSIPSSTSNSSEPDLISASTHLSLAISSLSFFSNSSTHSKRSQLLTSLLSQFSEIVEQKLTEALKKKPINIGLVRNLREGMMKVGMENQWLEWWREERTEKVKQEWKKVELLEELDDPSSKEPGAYKIAFKDWLPHFFNEVLALINEEKLFLSSIHSVSNGSELEDQDSKSNSNSQVEVLTSLLTYLLGSLKPALQERLDGCFKIWDSQLQQSMNATKTKSTTSSLEASSQKDERGGMELLLQTHEVVKDFSISFREILRKLGFDSEESTTSIQDSKSFLISIWERSLFSTFISYQENYLELESNQLSMMFKKLDSVSSPPPTLLSSFPQIFKDRINLSFNLSLGSLKRSKLLTFNFKAVENFEALDDLWGRALKEEIGRIEDLDSEIGPSTNGKENQRSGEEEEIDWEKFSNLVGLLEGNKEGWSKLEELKLKWNGIVESERESGVEKLKNLVIEEIEDTKEEPQDSKLNSQKTSKLRQDLEKLGEKHGTVTGEIGLLLSLDSRASNSTSIPLNPNLSNLFPFSKKLLFSHLQLLHSNLHSLLLSPILSNLSNYSNLNSWSSSQSSNDLENEYQLNMPKFSISQTEEMNKVLENCLNLPRLLEWGLGSGGGDFMGWGAEWLEGGKLQKEKNERNKNEKRRSSGGKEGGSKRKSLVVGATKEPMQTSNSSHQEQVPNISSSSTSIDESSPGEFLSSETVLPHYLRSLLLTLLNHYTNEVLPQIKVLSSAGKSQLKADCEGLSNVAEALGMVANHDEDEDEVESQDGFKTLKKWLDILDLDEEISNQLSLLKRGENSEQLRNLASLSLEKKERGEMERIGFGEKKEEKNLEKHLDENSGEENEEERESRLRNEKVELERRRLGRLRDCKVFEGVKRMRGWN